MKSKPEDNALELLDRPENGKDKAWHKDMALDVIASMYVPSDPYEQMATAAKMAQGDNDFIEDEYVPFSAITPDASFPVPFLSINTMWGAMTRFAGVVGKMGTVLSVRANSQEAIKRKSKAVAEIEADFALMALYQQEQETNGIPLISEDMPMDSKSLKAKVADFKEGSEVAFQRILEYYYKSTRYIAIRPKVIQHAFLYGRAAVIPRLDPDLKIRIDVVEPYYTFFDHRDLDINLRDISAVCFTKLYSPVDIMREYSISAKELNDMLMASSTSSGAASGRIPSVLPALSTINFALGSTNGWTTTLDGYVNAEGSNNPIPVVRVQFIDVCKKKGYTFENKNGERIYKIFEETPEGKYDSKRQRKKAVEEQTIYYHTVRYCDMLPNGHVLAYGKAANLPIDPDNWSECRLPLCSFVPFPLVNTTMSYASIIRSSVYIRDIAINGIQKLVYRDRGSFFLMDESIRSEKLSFTDAIAFAEMQGALIVNSNKNGLGRDYPSLPVVDRGIQGQQVAAYVNIFNMATAIINDLTGQTEALQGAIAGQNLAAGVMSMSLNQGEAAISVFVDALADFEAELFTKILNLAKIAEIESPGLHESIVGEDYLQYVSGDGMYSLESHGVFVSTDKRIAASDKSAITMAVTEGLRTGQVTLDVAIKALLDDPIEAETALKKYFEEAKKEADQIRVQQNMMQMKMAETNAAAQRDKAAADIQRAQIAAGATTQAAQVAAQTNLQRKRMDAATSMAREQDRIALERERMSKEKEKNIFDQ